MAGADRTRQDPSGPIRSRSKGAVAAGAAIYLLSAALTFSAIAFVAGRMELAEKDRRIVELQRENAAGKRVRDATEQRFLRMIRDMETAAQHQRETIARLSALHVAVRRELEITEQQVSALTEERDSARELATSLGQGARNQELAQRDVEKERRTLGAKLSALEARLASLTEERDMARRTEKGLRWQMEQLEQKLTAVSIEREAASKRRASLVTGQAQAIEKVLAKAGVKIDKLLARADDDSREGIGGPLMAEEDADVASLDAETDPAQNSARLEALRRVVASLPLAQPMDGYRVMSDYGRRADPITRRRAVHEGMDLSGARDQRIKATQAGTVIQAGRNGDYGVTVEIDHGMGITTRFAHMKTVLVREGDKVTIGREIGIIGSTGRSTGRHLHYEIRLDGRAINPAPFLEATKLYGNVLKG